MYYRGIKVFKKFVQITALFNFPIALGIMVPEILSPQADTFTVTVALGAFLMFAGAALLWSASDIENRAPIVVWSGLVRLVGFMAVAYAASLGMAPKSFVVIAGMDLLAVFVYIFGSMKATGLSFKSLFLGRTHALSQ